MLILGYCLTLATLGDDFVGIELGSAKLSDGILPTFFYLFILCPLFPLSSLPIYFM